MIIDTNADVTAKLPELMAAAKGDLTIGRYLDRLMPNNPKVIKPAEARAIAAAGAGLFLIYEIGGKPSGSAQGDLDRRWCEAYLPTIGAPSTAAIYNTVDYDAPASDMASIIAYFAAFQSSHYRNGGYGSGFVLSDLFGAKVIELRWLACSRGFTGTKEALAGGAYDLAQSLSPKIAGLDVDTNYLLKPGSDFGAFVPFAPPPVAAANESYWAHWFS